MAKDKKKDVQYTDVIHAACLSGEEVFKLKTPEELEQYIPTSIATIKESMELIYSEMACLYIQFRRAGFNETQSTIRTRKALLQMAESELNLKVINTPALLEPVKQHIPTDPKYQTEEQKAELEKGEPVIIAVELAKEGGDFSVHTSPEKMNGHA